MEDKKYEAGKVEISSAEYRDLVTEAVEASRNASEARSEKWRIESERDKLAKELELANKKIAELESFLSALQVGHQHSFTPAPNATPYKSWCPEVTYSSNDKEGN